MLGEQQKQKENNMKNTCEVSPNNNAMRTEYDFSDSTPNKYAELLKRQDHLVRLDADVYQIFDTDDKVNNALRAFIQTMHNSSNANFAKS